MTHIPNVLVATQESEGTLLQSGEDTQELEGNILDTPDYDANMFSVPNGGEKTATVQTALTLELHREGEIIATAEATQPVEITTTQEEITATAQVGGTGGVTVQEP